MGSTMDEDDVIILILDKLPSEYSHAASLATAEAITSRWSKHIDIKYHYVREQAARGFLQLEYTPSAANTADIFTKPLPEAAHVRHTASLMARPLFEEGVDVRAESRPSSASAAWLMRWRESCPSENLNKTSLS